jgi:hypothetical protein
MNKKFYLALIFLGVLIFCLGCAEANECTGDHSCNDYNPRPSVCPNGQNLMTLWIDNDNDDLAERYSGNGISMDVCAGISYHIPDGWTDHQPPPWDNCPNDPTNTCGNTNPSIFITAIVDGHTVTTTGFPVYLNGNITRVNFYSGTTLLGGDTTPNPWQNIWTNVPDGIYTLRAVCYTNDGKTDISNYVTVTIGNNACLPRLRCSYGFTSGVTLFNGVNLSCLTSVNGQDPSWQWLPFQTCGGIGNACTFEGNIWPDSITMNYCEINGAAPSGLGGNPIPSFPPIGGYSTDWFLTHTHDGATIIYHNQLASGSFICEVSVNCTTWAQVDVDEVHHDWGTNYRLDFSSLTDPESGNTLNVYIGTYIDSDGDGFYNYCPASLPGCVPDNCIRFANPTQADSNSDGIGDACLNHPDPLENDSDNDWYLDGEDNFPNDRTRF